MGDRDRATDVGSERNYRVTPDATKELGNAEVVASAWSPADVQGVGIHRREPAEEAEALGTITEGDSRRRRAPVVEVAREAKRLRLASVASEPAP